MSEIFLEKGGTSNNTSGKVINKNTTTVIKKETIKINKDNTTCDEKCQKAYTDSLNSYGIGEESQYRGSYYSDYDPEMAATYSEYRGYLSVVGVSLAYTGNPLGIVLTVPKGLDYLGESVYSFERGDIEGGVQNLAALASLGLATGISYKSGSGGLSQTTNKETNKLFNGDGVYKLPNGTSVVEVSGSNVGRINYVNGVASNYYGVVDGKLVMGNIASNSTIGQLTLTNNSSIYELPSLASVSNPNRIALELENMATDPAIGNKVTNKTIAEREVGIGLEKLGEVNGLVRDPSGRAEFIDSKGQKWDVKAFNSNFPPEKGGYTLEKSMNVIRDSLSNDEKVMLDTRNLKPEHLKELKIKVIEEGLNDKVKFWP